MLNKFFKFLSGYVIISVYGKNSPRFLNICTRRGMRIYDTRPIKNGMEITLAKSDFMNIRPVAKKCRVRVKIKEKHGALHTARLYKRRYVFLIAIALCAAACAVSTRFIWLVEINGADESNIESITKTLDEIGVRRGALKSKLPEGMEIKRRIINGTDGVAWAWVYIDGAKARVEISEKIVPPEIIDKNEPCDIVAACDGVIQNMTVKEGEERVSVGDAVSAGDLLVAGTVSAYREGDAENYLLVHSIAEINAYTTRMASGDYKLYREIRTPTGRVKRRRVIDLFGKAVSIPFGELKFENYDRKENRRELNIPFFGYSGIALHTVEYSEVLVNRDEIPIETALDFAKNDLEEKISKGLTVGSILTDERLEYEQTDNETIRVTVKMNFTENIAAEVPLSVK